MIYRMVSTNTSNSSTISKLYVALVRPHLEYATQVWNPHLTKDINCLEKDQKFALRICSKNYHEPCQNLLEHTNYHHFKPGGCFCVYVLRTTALGPPMTGPCLVGAGPSPVLTGLSPPMIGPGPVGTGPSPVLTGLGPTTTEPGLVGTGPSPVQTGLRSTNDWTLSGTDWNWSTNDWTLAGRNRT